MNHELPQGWEEAEIGSFNYHKGASITPSDYPDEIFELYSVPVFPTGNPEYVAGKDIGSSKQLVIPGDVLLCKINPRINRVWVVSEKTDYRQIASSEWIVIRNQYLNPRYLINAFSRREFRDQLCSEVTGVGGSLTRAQPKKVAGYSIPLAPLPEQIRIADKLDRTLARVNAAQARLDKIPTLIKRFRQSVLAAATSGELTQEWRGLNVKKGDFTTVLLGDISEVSTGVTPLKSNRSYYEDGQIPWLTSAVTGDFYVYNSEKFITNKAVDECRLKLYPPGTLLMAMYGEGKTRGQVTEIKISATVNQACAAIQIVSDSVSKEYVRLCLDDNYERTRMMAEGGAQPNLNLKKVRSIPINLPEFDEQHEIVRRVESLFALADSVEKQYQDAKARTDRMTQAILAKAFRGELVPQDPNDEPAEVLLQRIRQQRAEQATAGKRGKARKVSG